jgi:hypothetical protein
MKDKPEGWKQDNRRHYEAKVFGKASSNVNAKSPKYLHRSKSNISEIKNHFGLTNDDLEIIWDALYGRRSQNFAAGDHEGRDKYNRVLEKIDANLPKPHYTNIIPKGHTDAQKVDKVLTDADFEVIWDALYGRRASSLQGNDRERADRISKVLDKVDAGLKKPHYTHLPVKPYFVSDKIEK